MSFFFIFENLVGRDVFFAIGHLYFPECFFLAIGGESFDFGLYFLFFAVVVGEFAIVFAYKLLLQLILILIVENIVF